MPPTLNLDAIEFFTWDRQLNRYRWRNSQRQSGQFASKQAVLLRVNQYVSDQSNELIALADKLNDRSITLTEFQKEAGQKLKQIHVAQAILGKGGVENITVENWLAVGRELRRQYHSGKDTVTGDRYGLKWLASDISEGKVSLAQLKNRLSMYAASGKVSFWQANSDLMAGTGKIYGVRRLGANHHHCAECIAYSRLPPQPIGKLILPGQACSCRSRCHCSLGFYSSLEEALKDGKK